MQNFRNLTVWQKAHRLTLAVYQFTRSFPREGNIRIEQPNEAM